MLCANCNMDLHQGDAVCDKCAYVIRRRDMLMPAEFYKMSEMLRSLADRAEQMERTEYRSVDAAAAAVLVAAELCVMDIERDKDMFPGLIASSRLQDAVKRYRLAIDLPANEDS